MKKTILIGTLTLALGACSTASQKNEAQGQIDILPAFENPTELKVSHLGKSIRYVPLETNDSSLIGEAWNLRLLEDKILVSCKEANLLFDRQTGKFLRKISSVGQGPREYTQGNYIPFINPQTGDIYFNRTPEKMIGFNQEGKFLGEWALPFKWSRECYLTFDGDQALAHTSRLLYRFDKRAQINDTIVRPIYAREPDMNDIESIYVLVGKMGQITGVGMMGFNGVLVIKYKSGARKDIFPNNYPSIYHYGDEIRFHEAYNDTVFSIEGNKLSPRWIFHTGECHFPKELLGDAEESLERIVVTYVMENDRFLFFQCAKGLFAEGKAKICNAIYHKEDGTLLMNDKDDGFTDDLTRFMPFHPEDITPKGEYAGALNIWDIQEWLEEHPDVKLEGALAPLEGLADDANPVVVIVEP